MLNDELFFAPVTILGSKIRTREISPVELTEGYLKRLETLAPALNAVVTITRKRALQEAHLAEREISSGNYRGLLHGIPYGAKDLLATKGIPATWGAPPFRNQVFEFDATVIARLQSAGAILLGKLSMLEMAGVGHYRYASASLTGPGLNPWDPGTYTGGSSSGSAAATAAGLVGFSIGSETWGSILTPASFCGITGLRPTYGRVSRYGAMALSWTMDKLGPMCRSVEDCEIVLAAIAGHDPKDPATLHEKLTPREWAKDLSGKKIGVVQEDFANHGEAEVERGFLRAVAVLRELGASCEPVVLPELPYDEVAEIIVASEAACSLENVIKSGKIWELVDAAQQAGIVAGAEIKAVDYLKAMRIRTLMKTEFENLWKQYDALVAPTSLVVSPSVRGEVHDLYLTPLVAAGNLLGFPAITVPCGFGRGGLPIALSFVVPALKEALVLQLGYIYQVNTEWHGRYPPLFSRRGKVMPN